MLQNRLGKKRKFGVGVILKKNKKKTKYLHESDFSFLEAPSNNWLIKVILIGVEKKYPSNFKIILISLQTLKVNADIRTHT